MRLGTKSRYAVMAMVDMAQAKTTTDPVTLAEISARQSLPVQYLEQLFLRLRKAGLVQGVRGQGGGYVLVRDPCHIRIGQIIEAVGEEVRATGCSELNGRGCQGGKGLCATHHLWANLDHVINHYLGVVTLADVAQGSMPSPQEVIGMQDVVLGDGYRQVHVLDTRKG